MKSKLTTALLWEEQFVLEIKWCPEKVESILSGWYKPSLQAFVVVSSRSTLQMICRR
jgi:hypothetical protein